MPRYIFEVSLNLEEMGVDEAISLGEIYGGRTKLLGKVYNGAIVETEKELRKGVERRFGLIRSYSKLISLYNSPEEIDPEDLFSYLRGRSYYIEVERDPRRWKREDSISICRRIAKGLRDFSKVSFKSPEVILKVYLGENIAVGTLKGERPKEVTKIGPNSFPFKRPIVMDRRIARAMINLTLGKEGEVFLDPMCGTGTFLIEAGKMGMKVIGSDIDEKMIWGAFLNLAHFGVFPEKLIVCDVSNLWRFIGEADSIATDPPYGRSSSTWGKPLEEVYSDLMASLKEILPKNKRASVIFPRREDHFDIGAKYMRPIKIYEQRVHQKLTRYIAVYER